MLQNGRGADNAFRPNDHLYHRCTKDDVEAGMVLPPKIRVENPSVNWSKYSKPWDVIFDYPLQGIVRFVVCKLPRELPKEPTIPGTKAPQPHSFIPEHVPLPNNYSHSEIQAERAGARLKRINSEFVRKEFQAAMSAHAVILRWPRE
jgi:hypothetical protein